MKKETYFNNRYLKKTKSEDPKTRKNNNSSRNDFYNLLALKMRGFFVSEI